jgi:chitin disaccharide deacetylase
MVAGRYLIVNADDFGQSRGVNRGIIQAHEQGIVTSASLMVRWPAAAEAAAYALEHPRLSVGLHLDLGEWACQRGAWSPVYQVVPPDDAAQIAAEAARQLSAFRGLLGREPTHLDSHQHTHLGDAARPVIIEIADRLGVPLRRCSPRVRYCGSFYGQTPQGSPLPDVLCPEGLLRILNDLPSGVTELGCHPGLDNDLQTMYGAERAREVEVLCDPQVRTALPAMGIELCSFHGTALFGG